MSLELDGLLGVGEVGRAVRSEGRDIARLDAREHEGPRGALQILRQPELREIVPGAARQRLGHIACCAGAELTEQVRPERNGVAQHARTRMVLDPAELAVHAFARKRQVHARRIALIVGAAVGEEQPVPAEVMVNAEEELPRVVLPRVVLRVVQGARSAVRHWEEIEHLLRERVEPGRRNAVIGELVADVAAGAGGIGPGGQRVVDADQVAAAIERARKVAGTLGRRRHGHIKVVGRALRHFFPVDEEERAVAAVVDLRQVHRSAGGDAEFVAAECGLLQPLAIRRPARRVELVVAHEFVERAVQLVGTGAGGRSQDAAARTPELRREIVRDDLELLDDLERRRVVDVVGGAVAGLGAVHQDLAGVRTASADDRPGAGGSFGQHTGRVQRQAVRVAAQQRQFQHLAAGYDGSERRCLLLEHHRTRRHRDLILNGADFERYVHRGHQPDGQGDPRYARLLEPGRLSEDFVFAGVQEGGSVMTLRVCGRGCLDAGSRVLHDDLSVADYGAGGIGNCAGYGALLDLGEDGKGEKQKDQEVSHRTSVRKHFIGIRNPAVTASEKQSSSQWETSRPRGAPVESLRRRPAPLPRPGRCHDASRRPSGGTACR